MGRREVLLSLGRARVRRGLRGGLVLWALGLRRRFWGWLRCRRLRPFRTSYSCKGRGGFFTFHGGAGGMFGCLGSGLGGDDFKIPYTILVLLSSSTEYTSSFTASLPRPLGRPSSNSTCRFPGNHPRTSSPPSPRRRRRTLSAGGNALRRRGGAWYTR